MASIIVNNGLQRIGTQASQSTSGAGPTYSATRHIQTMSVDDSTVAFAAGDTALNTGGAVTNMYDAALTSAPARSGQTHPHIMTIPTGSGNFTIKRIALHDDTAANVTTSSTSLIAGVDGQTLSKTSDFTMTITLNLLYTSV